MKNAKLLSWLLLLILGFVIISGCTEDEEDDITSPDYDPNASVLVYDQTITNDTVTVAEAQLGQNGWVVVHADNGNNSPLFPDKISEAVQINEGTTYDIKVALTDEAELADGDKIWVVLHIDNGTEGTYEYDGGNTDVPVKDGRDEIIMRGITVQVP